jgi:uncharacterized repeat protein (TIGR01451 family)
MTHFPSGGRKTMLTKIVRRLPTQITNRDKGDSKIPKLFRIMIAVGLIAVMLMTWNGAFVWAATPPEPTYGTATVDGNYGEWDLSNDFFANMYQGGDPNKDILSKLYLRYDCSTNTLYALVLVETGHTIDVDAGDPGEEHYIKISDTKIVDDGDQPPSGGPPDFEWIGLSGDGTTADGWETSASLDPGTYNDFDVHTQVDDDETSAVEGRQIDLVINCLADLVVSKWGPAAVSITCGSRGEFMWYISVFNQGSAAAEDVTVADTLPNDVEYLSDTSGITPDIFGNVITWDLWRLDPGTGVYFSVRVKVKNGVQPGTTLTNVLDVSTSTTESDYSNNHAEWSTLVSSDKGSDVWVEKIGPGSIFAGSYMVYTINYGNGDWHCEGSMHVADAENVTITDIMSNWDEEGDMLPNYLSYVSDTSGFSHSGTGTVDDPIVWTVGTLPANNCGSFEVTVYVHPDAPGGLTLSNDAIISSGTEECDATNNDYEVDTPVEVSGSLGDYVWIDESGDGEQGEQWDGGPDEVGINDVELELWLDDGDGVFEVGEDTKQTTMLTQNDGSGNTGWYLFTGLSAGTYFVRIAPQEFDSGGTLYYYNPTEPNKTDADDALDSDGDNPTCPYDPGTDTGTCGQASFEDNILAMTTLGAGAQDLTIDFGVLAGSPPTAVTLSSFAATSSGGNSANWLWLGLAGVTMLVAGSLFWAKRRAD